MRLICVGLNWKTPVAIRERLAIEGGKLPSALAALRERFPGAEFVLLSTCNRTELYAASSHAVAGPEIHDLCDFLADFHHASLTEFYDHLYFHEEAGTVLHLFTVASGLDSLVLGEGQILGQVRDAYQAAASVGACSNCFHGLFQRSLSVAKRVQTETDLSKGRLSIASAAVDFIRGVFEEFSGKTLLVIGAGKMAELTLTHLQELQPGRTLICNRSRERAGELIRKFGGSYHPFEDLTGALTQSDIVISSTGSDRPIVMASDFHAIMKARRHRLMAVVDIAVPRDFDTAIGELDNVLLWNIDDLEKVRLKTMRSREKELDSALRIVEEETSAYQAALAFQQSGPVIGRLEREYQRIMEEELQWLLPQLNGMADDHKDKIRHFAHRLKNKFLHPPKAALREEAKAGTPHSLLDAMRRLFGLQDE